MPGREVAWRIVAAELEASTVVEKGADERSATYLLSPLGARMNRILLTGMVSPVDRLAGEVDRPFIRARLEDPTGTVSLSAGSFQPRAQTAMKALPGPGRALVVGKPHLFVGREGVPRASVRVEAIRTITEDAYRHHLIEALGQTLDRLELSERVRADANDSRPEEALPSLWVKAARDAAQQYPGAEVGRFRTVLRSAWKEIDPHAPRSAPPAARTAARVTRSLPSPPAAPTSRSTGEEALFLELVDELSEGAIDGYADLREVYHRLAARGIAEGSAEKTLNRLEASGSLEEPIVGKLRRA